jgi:hypothetical protein
LGFERERERERELRVAKRERSLVLFGKKWEGF